MIATGSGHEADEGTVDAVLALLGRRHGTSFSNYKPGTVRRRLARRARLAGATDLESYRRTLLDDDAELDALYDDLLIEVTSFFRDAAAFDRVAALVVPDLVGRIARGESPRVWVPGCASGEEAWSLAMLLIEGAEAADVEPDVSIVATDLHPRSLGRARRARYPAASVAHLPPGRVTRFFERSAGDEVRVCAPVRTLVRFHEHDVLGDPPAGAFALVCCRNVLIYFTETAQGRALERFRAALVPGGWLVLGASEPLVGAAHGFDTVDTRRRIHRRERLSASPAPAPGAHSVPVPPHRAPSDRSARPVVAGDRHASQGWLAEAARRAARTLLEVHVPPALLLAPDGTVMRTFGESSVLLSPADDGPGGAMRSFGDPVGRLRPKLRPMLRSALQRSRTDPVSRIERPVGLEDATGRIVDHDITIEPVEPAGADGPMLLMVARRTARLAGTWGRAGDGAGDYAGAPAAVPATGRARGRGEARGGDAEALDRALAALEASQAALHETRQALAASDEELQSAHEELDTVDAEYRNRMAELARAQRTLVTLGREHRAFVDDTDSFVARWRRDDGTLVWCNAAYARLFDEVPESLIGRRLVELLPRDQVEALVEAAERIPPGEVRRTEVVRELPDGNVSYTVALTRPLTDRQGRVVEYQSTGQDLSPDYRYRRELEGLIDAVVAPGPDRESVLGRILRIGMRRLDLESASIGWHEDGVYRAVATEGRPGAWPDAGRTLALGETYCDALPPPGSALACGRVADGPLADHPARAVVGQEAYAGVRLDVRGRSGSANFAAARPASRVLDAGDEVFLRMIGGWIEGLLDGAAPAGAPVPAASAPAASDAVASASAARLDRFAHAMSHELRAPLRLISSFSGFLAEDLRGSLDEGGRRQLEVIGGAARRAHRLVGSLFDYAHTEHGPIRLAPVDLGEAARRALAELAPALEAAGADVRVDRLPTLPADEALVRLLFVHLVGNAVQYRDPRRPCRVRIRAPEGTVLQVEDDGTGFGPDAGRHILEPFTRLSAGRASESSGMGLAVCVAVCVRHGWTLTARGDPGVGATFRVEPETG